MAYTVVINAGKKNVSLPGGYLAQAGETVNLTTEQLFSIKPEDRDELFASVTEFQLPPA